MTIKKTLASIALASTIGLSGCGYKISQDGVDKMIEMPIKEFVKISDNYMNVHHLIKEKNYDQAQSVLEQYLTEQIRENAEAKGVIQGTSKISKNATERIGKIIDRQIGKIQLYLKEN